MYDRGEKAIKQRITTIIEDQNSENPKYSDKLNEKGVECSILIPFFEQLLGFDPIDDIQYELPSKNRSDHRFDFLLDGKILVEAKPLGEPLVGEVKDQITDYIVLNDEIDYGILSNGWEFSFMLQKKFIEKVANLGEKITGAERQIYHVFNITLDDPKFFEVMSYFSKDTYDETFRAIARFVERVLVPRSGPMPNIVSDKELNSHIVNLIRQRLDFRKGIYLDEIRNGQIKSGEKRYYDDGNVRIEVKIQSDGTVKLPKNSIKVRNINKILEEGCFRPLLKLISNGWHDKDQEFEEPRDILRKATGKQRLSRNKYIFKKP